MSQISEETIRNLAESKREKVENQTTSEPSTTTHQIMSALAPSKSKPACWIVDFDCTTTINHTFYSGEDAAKLVQTESGKMQVTSNLRNKEWFSGFLRKQSENGDIIIFLTAHPNISHVVAYLNILFDSNVQWRDQKSPIYHGAGHYLKSESGVVNLLWCSPNIRPSGISSKNEEIALALKVQGHDIEQFGRDRIVLMDDDKGRNIEPARKAGINVVWAEPGNNNYMKEAEEIALKLNPSNEVKNLPTPQPNTTVTEPITKIINADTSKPLSSSQSSTVELLVTNRSHEGKKESINKKRKELASGDKTEEAESPSNNKQQRSSSPKK